MNTTHTNTPPNSAAANRAELITALTARLQVLRSRRDVQSRCQADDLGWMLSHCDDYTTKNLFYAARRYDA